MTRLISRPATKRAIALLTLAAMVSFLATRDVRRDFEPTDPEVDTRLNYALFDFRARMLDEFGNLAAAIEAPELRNDALTGIGTVSSPEIYVRQADNDWQLDATTAVVSADREFITLTGDVKVVRYNETANDRVEIDTSDLLVAVTPRTASTDARVNIRHAGDRLDATGLRLDMMNDQFELLDDVSAVYDTP